MRILIIGGMTAGPKVAARARRLLPEAEITVVERGPSASIASCGIPYFVGGHIRDFNQLSLTSYGVQRDPQYFANERAVRVLTGLDAVAIDRKNKQVALVRADGGERFSLAYDKLVLATGAGPAPVPEGVYSLGDPGEARNLVEAAAGAKQAVVLGAGVTGMELASGLLKRKLWVSLVEPGDQILPGVLDRELALLLAYRLEEEGLEIHTGQKVSRLDANTVVTERETFEADLVIATGERRPETGMARAAGLAIGPTGAVAVDRHLATSDPDIYAVGACAESRHLVSGQPVLVSSAGAANRQARVAGDNLAGIASVFEGVLGTAVLNISGWNVGRTGLGEEEARALGFDVVSAVCANHDRSHFYPGHDNLILKLIVERGSRRLLGAQGLGQGDVVKRIDVAATVLSFGGTVDQLAVLDLGYAPPYSMPADPLQQTADVVRNKLGNVAQTVTAAELHGLLASSRDFVLLDVRTADQFQYRHIGDPRSVQLALGELRGRLSEIPRDKPVVVVCPLGTRAYEAARILTGAGFPDVRFLEGGLQGWPYDLD